MSNTPLFEIKGLHVSFQSESGEKREVVRGVSFQVFRGKTLGILGESGSGKSMTLYSCMGLTKWVGAQVEVEQLSYQMEPGQKNPGSLLPIQDSDWSKLRGRHMGMIFQEAGSALNPILTVEAQLKEGIRLRLGSSGAHIDEDAEAVAILEAVQIREPRQVLKMRVGQLSGGMQQRAMIAIALSSRPSLVFADEPTSAIDLTNQMALVELLKSLQLKWALGLVVVSHDLNFLAALCDQVLVMKSGEVIESGPTQEVFTQPKHPYTRELVRLSNL